MKRVKIGIEGIDRLLSGGIPAGSSVLVTGSCGTGKSILSLQYLVNGALSGEPGVYLAFEESKERIFEHAETFGWDLSELERRGLLVFYNADTDDMGEVLGKVRDIVREKGARRLVVDSLTTMMEHGLIYRSQISRDMSRKAVPSDEIRFPSEGHDVTRKDIYYIIGQINRMGATSLLISEVAEKSSYLSRDTISEFACDGVLLLEINAVGGKAERLISVKKMRGTPVDLTMSVLKFTPQGIAVEE